MSNDYRRQCFVAAVSYSGSFLFGYAAGWSAPVLQKLKDKPDMLYHGKDPQVSRWLASVTLIGCMVGIAPLGPLANKIGRRRTLAIGAVLNPVCYIAHALIKDAYILIFFRAVIGIAMGNILSMNLVYLGEIASTEIRGILLGTSGVFISLGMLAVFTVGHYVSYPILNYFAAAASLIYLCGLFYVPESPVFLRRKGREEEARAVLVLLNRHKDAEKLSEIKLEVEAQTQEVRWRDLFTVKCNRKALCITCILYILQQFSGISPMIAYSTTIFDLAGSSIPPHLATIIVGVVQLLAGLITPLFIERYGRRFLLLVSTILTCLSLAILSVYLNLDAYGNPIVLKIKWLPLAMTMLFFIAYSFGFGIIPATLVGEMFELNLRSAGTSIVVFVNSAAAFLVLYCFGYLITVVGMHVAFIMFSAVCAATVLFTLAFVPETKGKSLIEVQKMLAK